MSINQIIKEEIQNLVERQEGIYTIPELVQLLAVYGLSQPSIDIYKSILIAAFKEGGDEKVEEVFKHFTGIDVEHISRGRYMLQRLVDPDNAKQAQQNLRYAKSDAEYGVAPKKFARENQDRFA